MFDQPTELPKPFQISTFIHQVKTRFNFCQKKPFARQKILELKYLKPDEPLQLPLRSSDCCIIYLSMMDWRHHLFRRDPFCTIWNLAGREFMSKHTLVYNIWRDNDFPTNKSILKTYKY